VVGGLSTALLLAAILAGEIQPRDGVIAGDIALQQLNKPANHFVTLCLGMPLGNVSKFV